MYLFLVVLRPKGFPVVVSSCIAWGSQERPVALVDAIFGAGRPSNGNQPHCAGFAAEV